MMTSRASPLRTFLLLLPLAACGAPEPPPEPPLRPVRTVRVEAVAAQEVRSFSGVARAAQQSKLSFRVGGTLEALGVEVGDEVHRGQVLARLDPTDYELQLEQGEAAAAQARAADRRAEADYERVRGLYEANNASKSDLDAARAAAESAQAQLEAAEKQVETARRAVGYTTLLAPAAGAIATVDVELNENVGPGQRVVLLVTSQADPEVEVAVPEALISRVAQDDEVEVSFPALPDRVLPGVVTEVGVAVVGGATTFPVTVRLAQASPQVRSGMAAEVLFRFGEPGVSRFVVPPVAVLEDARGRHVFVLEPRGDGTGVVRRRAVEVGGLAAGGLEITSGLAAGEQVVTAGSRRLADGMEVAVLEGQEGPQEPEGKG